MRTKKLWTVCANAQADLSILRAHVRLKLFSHNEADIIDA